MRMTMIPRKASSTILTVPQAADTLTDLDGLTSLSIMETCITLMDRVQCHLR